ncbi:MAG: chromosomal replication initiator protein DnaA [Candidatus Paceibacterota bacterium]
MKTEIMDNEKLWKNVLIEIELSISKANFNTWFKDTYVIKKENGVVQLSVPNTFVKDWLSTKYHSMILKYLRDLSPDIYSLEYIVEKNRGKKEKKEIKYQENNASELPLANTYINKESNLNPRYSFDSFVVGPFNELAYAASQAVIKDVGSVYNPFFVYGGTGHGKTHIIQAIGNKISEKNKDLKVFYVTSERFVIDYVTSIQLNKVTEFKEKYRKYDVLIMDDIQFLSNKEKTQEELFHLFNTLYDNNKQIVFSSDKHPNYIPGLEDRLKSRFGAGMIVDIPAPDQESRAAILKKKAQMNSISLSDEIINYLAYSIEGNIRDLEGILNSLACQMKIKNDAISLSEVKNLARNTKKPQKNVSPSEVIRAVAVFYNIEEEYIHKKTRKKEVIRPRQVTMYLLREDYKISYPSIGEKLGGRDHTTVIHSCEKIKSELKVNENLCQELEQIRTMIG